MKRHQTSSTTGPHADDRDATQPTLTNGSAGAGAAHARPHLALVQPRPWSHTLILRGDLDDRSAPELEDEIECLCQEGVTALTLDLHQLDAIDSHGAHVIASQDASFKKRGLQLAVLVGSPVIHHALTEAGWTDPSTPTALEGSVRRFPSPPSLRAIPDLATTTMRDLTLD
jgi:anti-anti-sigma factor